MFIVYPSKNGWRWQMRKKNGRIMGDSGEAYKTPFAVRRAIQTIFFAIWKGNVVTAIRTKKP